MIAGESELDMTARHVREGQANIDRQREIVAKLEAHGHSTIEARELLQTFEQTQALHRQHLARLLRRGLGPCQPFKHD